MRWFNRKSVFAAALWIAPAAAIAAPVTAVHSVGLTVSDLDKSVDFYTRVLSFNKVGDTEVAGESYEKLTGIFGMRAKSALLRLGDEYLVLTEFYAPRGRPAPVDARSNDRSFQHVAIIVSDMDKAYAWVHDRHATFASPNPQRLPDWNKNAGGIKAFYFKDPDGHPLEILWFPEGKGDAKWHKPNRAGHLFLGIDHTAIVVASTDESLRFYKGLLGLEVKGESENYGVEQERLNNVYGAHLKITGLRAASGPGIEFLQYLMPLPCGAGQIPLPQIRYGDPAPCGRLYPVDSRPNDLWHWQTNLVTLHADEVAQTLERAKSVFVSSGTVALSTGDAHSTKAFMARDPDGHAVLFMEK